MTSYVFDTAFIALFYARSSRLMSIREPTPTIAVNTGPTGKR